MLHLHQLRCGLGQQAAGLPVDPEQVLQGIVDHADQPQHQQDLDHQRHDPQHWTVLFPFIKLHAPVGDGVLVAIVLYGDPVQFRLHPDHFDGVFLDHDTQGQQDHLADQRKEQDRTAVIPGPLITKPHDDPQGCTEGRIDPYHQHRLLRAARIK